MLLELNVKDIALIKKAGVEFGEGFNVLTGETGAGKSVIIDSAMLALGAKVRGDMVRRGADYGYVELIFSVENDSVLAKLKELGIEPDENGCIVISRRIMRGRSVSRINDETATLAKLRAAASNLLDIYGQNEFHTLMDNRKHLEILDEYLGENIREERSAAAEAYSRYSEARKRFAGFDMDEGERLRRKEMLEYQLHEIERAQLKRGEEEELSETFKRLSNARNIMEGISDAHRTLNDSGLDRALGALEQAMRYDDHIGDIYSELSDAQAIVDSVMRELSSYAADLEVDDRELEAMERRLDLIHSLEAKYGGGYDRIQAYYRGILKKLGSIESYETDKENAGKALAVSESALKKACRILSEKRREGARELCLAIDRELKDLGFTSAATGMEFKEKPASAEGSDEVCFTASLNPGEEKKPVSEAASGGELSRIMLAIKTVLARTDNMPTLIFDEIDTGISGRTAQRVAEKMDDIAMDHQVICVSHLPQIAAFADTHFLISKEESEGRNVTSIEKLDADGETAELARLLGGVGITRTVMESAGEMKALAKEEKKRRRSQ